MWSYNGKPSTINYKRASKVFLLKKRVHKTEEVNEMNDAQSQGHQTATVRDETPISKIFLLKFPGSD